MSAQFIPQHVSLMLLSVPPSSSASPPSFLSIPRLSQGCEHHHNGDADHGVRMQDILCKKHHWRPPLLSLQQAVQDEEEGLHRHQAYCLHDVQSWYVGDNCFRSTKSLLVCIVPGCNIVQQNV